MKNPEECETRTRIEKILSTKLLTIRNGRLFALVTLAEATMLGIESSRTPAREAAVLAATRLLADGKVLALDALTLARLHSCAIVGWEKDAYHATAGRLELLQEVEGMLREALAPS